MKAAKAMKTKRADADLSAQTMLTEGLGDTIGYRVPRSVDTESFDVHRGSAYLAKYPSWGRPHCRPIHKLLADRLMPTPTV